MAKRLGRGLDALIPSLEVAEDDYVLHIALEEIRPNPYQPRKTFEEETIRDLSHSIQEHGVIQPIIVRKSIKGYEIIAGERRFRASKVAGLKTIPAVVKSFTELQVMEIALIENLQREDLNAMEIAHAYEGLMDRFKLTQEELSKKVGKSRPHVTNFLRLLHLPDNVQEYVSRGTLSMGHARALLGVKKPKLVNHLSKACIEEGWSVRHLEEMVKKIEEKEERATHGSKDKAIPKETGVALKEMEETLQYYLGTSVKINKRNKKGTIEITFFNDEDLQRIALLLEEGFDKKNK